MGNSRSSFSNNFSSSFNTKMFRSKLSQLESTHDEADAIGDMEERIKEKQLDRQRQQSRMRFGNNRRRSVSVDVRSRRRMSSAFHENLVKINFVRNVRDVYSGVDSNTHNLGEGTWGTVKLVRRRSNPQHKAAVKILKLSKDMKSSRMKELRSEISLLQQIDHPHIAKLYETYEEEGCNLYLVMELFTGGELFDRVISLGHFRESKAADAIKQMMGAVQYLHSKGIVHRDLKLENFMYRAKNSDNLVLIDFGLSTRYGDFESGSEGSGNHKKTKKYMNEMVGSSYYMAPEVMKRKYGRECDLWSIGVIAYMLLCGHPPFAGDTDDEIMKRVKKGKFHFNHSAFKKVSASAIDFVDKLLKYEPNERMTAKEALVHEWLSEHQKKMWERRSQRRGSVMDGRVVENLKNFVQTNRFKKLALQAVAYSTRYEDIANLQELFEDIDQDQDGYITLEELQKALQDHPDVTDEHVRRIFKAMDIDKTQKVHLNEFIAATMNNSLLEDERVLREAFRKLDMSETGEIDRDDLCELLGKNFSQKQVDLIFSEFTKGLKDNRSTAIKAIENDQELSKEDRQKRKSKLTQDEFIAAMRRVKYDQTETLLSIKADDDEVSSEEEGESPPI